MPHELTELQAKRRREIRKQFLDNQTSDEFWKRIATADEQEIYLINQNRKTRWVQAIKLLSIGAMPKAFRKKVVFGGAFNVSSTANL